MVCPPADKMKLKPVLTKQPQCEQKELLSVPVGCAISDASLLSLDALGREKPEDSCHTLEFFQNSHSRNYHLLNQKLSEELCCVGSSNAPCVRSSGLQPVSR